jgi:hypothetical protein
MSLQEDLPSKSDFEFGPPEEMAIPIEDSTSSGRHKTAETIDTTIKETILRTQF